MASARVAELVLPNKAGLARLPFGLGEGVECPLGQPVERAHARRKRPSGPERLPP